MATKKTPKTAKPTPPPHHRVYDLFDDFKYELERAQSRPDGPMIGNFDVRFRRYRITVEVIDESVDVLKARIVKLWRGTANHHDVLKLLAAAKTIGVTLDSKEFGADVKRER